MKNLLFLSHNTYIANSSFINDDLNEIVTNFYVES